MSLTTFHDDAFVSARKKPKTTRTREANHAPPPPPPPPLYKVGVVETLKNHKILSTLPAIEEEHLCSGSYYLIGLQELAENIKRYSYLKDRAYLLNCNTNHVECVSLEGHLGLLIKEEDLSYVIRHTKLMPKISINTSPKKKFVVLKTSHHLQDTDYKDFNQWEVRDHFPFSGCRVVKTEETRWAPVRDDDDEELLLLAKYRAAGHIEKGEEKWDMFKGGIYNKSTMLIGHDFNHYKNVYIVGHTNVWWGDYKSFILVVEYPKDVYKVCLYNDLPSVEKLLRKLDAKPKTSFWGEGISSYNEILYGDYVLQLEFLDTKTRFGPRKTSVQIISLRDTPFYERELINNTFVEYPQ